MQLRRKNEKIVDETLDEDWEDHELQIRMNEMNDEYFFADEVWEDDHWKNLQDEMLMYEI